MLLGKVAALTVFAVAQAGCGGLPNKGLPEEDFAMPRDPGEAAAPEQDKEAQVSPAERSARRARRHIFPTSSAAAASSESAAPGASAAPSASPQAEAPRADTSAESADAELPLRLADGSLSPPMVRAMATTPDPERRAELLRAFGFSAADVEAAEATLRAPGEITEANLDGDSDRGWVVHIASGNPGLTAETHFIVWLGHHGSGLKPLATRVEHVLNACCEGPKATGELRVEVMNVHSTTLADTVIWREQTEPHATMTDASKSKSSVDIISLEHKKAEDIFHWESAGKADLARDGVIIGDADGAPRPVVVFTSAGKPKKTFNFDTKAFAYK